MVGIGIALRLRPAFGNVIQHIGISLITDIYLLPMHGDMLFCFLFTKNISLLGLKSIHVSQMEPCVCIQLIKCLAGSSLSHGFEVYVMEWDDVTFGGITLVFL